MSWSITIPPDTPAVDVMHTLRMLHQEKTAAAGPKGLPVDEEDQINAAIRAVDALWHEVAKHDADGNPTGALNVSISGHASKGHKKGDSINVSLSQPS